MPSLLPIPVPYLLPIISPFPGTVSSGLLIQIISNETPDKTSPDPLSNSGLLMSEAPRVILNKYTSGPYHVPTIDVN